jgi:CBS-domain-containing membrane protein
VSPRPFDIRTADLVQAATERGTTFGEAAKILGASTAPGLAVLDDQRRVIGLFSEGDLLKGLLPGYLENVRHTAFLDEDVPALSRRIRDVLKDPLNGT